MSIVNILTTARGSHQAVDPHGFRYHLNRKLDKVTYWRCTKKNCSVVGETPHHEHTTNILRQQAKSMEKNIIKKYAALPGTSTKAMLCEILQNILRIGYKVFSILSLNVKDCNVAMIEEEEL